MSMRRASLLLRARALRHAQQQQQPLAYVPPPSTHHNQQLLMPRWSSSSSSSSPASSSTPPRATANENLPLPRLDDPTAAFATRTTPELLRAYLVLRLCMIKPLVRHAEFFLSLSRRLLGDRLTDGLVGATFFRHFCAGVDGDAIQPTIARLRAANVQSIVDYAAEDDVESGAEGGGTGNAQSQQPPSASPAAPSSSYLHPRGEGVVGRTYDYADEAACDAHVATFLSAIDAVGRERDARGDGGFAAIKITALGNPLLLERMTSALETVRGLFSRAAADKGRVDLPAFARLYNVLFPHAPADRAGRAFAELLARSRRRGQGVVGGAAEESSVDLVDWCLAIRLQDMPGIAARLARHHQDEKSGSSSSSSGVLLAAQVEHAALDEGEVALAEAMLARVARLAERAAERRVRLMVDAEHTYFQGAIDHTAKALMARFNGGAGGDGGAAEEDGPSPPPPVVFNTYQCYLKDSRQRLEEDLELARRRGYRFAAKLVRGAYVQLERSRAERLAYPSPIFDTIDQTHANYDACVDLVLSEVKERGAEVMLATHNARSIGRACARMQELGIARGDGGVFFGQLLGMADACSYSLGASGYRVAKYVPYGPVRLVMPYLVRRAQENSTLLGPGARDELRLIGRELRRRAVGF